MLKESLKLFKEWRILFMIAVVLLALALIIPSAGGGVIVKSIGDDSPLKGYVVSGDVITWVNEKTITTAKDFYDFDSFTGTLRFMRNGQLTLAGVETPGLGVVVTDKPTTRLNMGLDLIGGTRVLLEAEGNVSDAVMQQVVATLETRVNIYGLREAKFQAVKDVSGKSYAQIEMAGGSPEEIEGLLARQGKFEGKISKPVTFTNGVGILQVSSKNYTVTYSDNSVVLDGTTMRQNDTTTLSGIETEFVNATKDGAIFMFTIFRSEDIRSVCIQDQPRICASRILPQNNGWEFNFQVFTSNEAAKRFADVTRGMKKIIQPTSGDSYLEGRLFLYLDDKLVTDLTIAGDLAGREVTQPSITGFRTSREEAEREKLTLQSILQSGSLPVKLSIVKTDQISPSLGEEFIRSASFAGLAAIFSVATVIYLRYRRASILIPMMVWSLSELVLILGAASLIKWTIDLSSIAGIIAAIGTGTNDQIMIIDEIITGSKTERVYTVKQRLKRAFFIVFGAAGTIIAAMLPLMFIGIGVMRGFAITTTVGVLIGIFITRPAFGKVAEKVLAPQEI